MAKPWLMLVGGKWHAFQQAADVFSGVLAEALGVKTTVAFDRKALKPAALARYGGVLAYTEWGKVTPAEAKALEAFVQGGGALVGVHCASDYQPNETLFKLFGVRFRGHPPVDEFPVTFADRGHWITHRLDDFRITDEMYLMDVDDSGSQVLATMHHQGRNLPAVLCRNHGAGRVFYTALGHDARSWSNATFRKLLSRGACWAAGRAEPKALGVAVVGYGGSFNMGKHHLDSMAAQFGFKPRAICDVSPARQLQARQDFPDLAVVGSTKDLLKVDGVDLVTCITPHNVHAPVTVELLNAGKNVVVEKPMAIDTKECTAMIDAARKNKVMVNVYHNRRYDGDFITLRQIVQSGAVGDVFQIEAFSGGFGEPGTWWRSDKAISGGIAHDWGAHFLDWITHLVPGRIKHVIGRFRKKAWVHTTNEDHAQIFVHFENGCIAEFETSQLAAVGKPKFRILGEKGGILQDHNDYVKLFAEASGIRGREMQVRTAKTVWHRYYQQLGDYLLLGEALEITAEEGRRNIAIVEAAEKSSAKGGVPVPVPYEDLIPKA
ncbi:MAG: ThuA domain-containing protein [Planctomycetes bacterium]|nr:ThuA domain-containing protein [Planctomycetota bacterium]